MTGLVPTRTRLATTRRRATMARRRLAMARDPVRPGDIVLLGDSITAAGDWNAWLPGQPIRNRGVSGGTSADALRHLRHQLDHPAQLFLMIGTNDLRDGVPIETVAANVGRILTTARRRTPDTLLFVQSVLPRGPEYADAVRRLNERLADEAGAAQAGYVDLYPLLADDEGAILPRFSDDALHLLPAGYDVWLDALRPLIAAS